MANAKYKILLIDDDQMLLDIYALKFKEGGHEIDLALGAEDALTKIRGGAEYDAVLLDVVMPNISGLDFLKILKEEKLIGNAVKIILSNQGDQADIKKAEEYDIDGYIIKANTVPSEVMKKVEEIISKK